MSRVWVKAAGAVALGLMLAACGPSSPNPVVTTGRVSGNVLPPNGAALQSVAAQAVTDPAVWANAPRVRGQVLIVGPDTLAAQAVSALSGVRVERVSSDLRRAFTPGGEDDAAFARRLAAAGLVVQPNFIYRALAAPVPNDPGYPANTGLPASNNPAGQPANQLYDQDYLPRIRAQQGWNIAFDAGNTTLAGALTAVLDTGVTANHEDLAGRLRPGRDTCAQRGTAANGDIFCQGTDNDPSETTGDQAGHGTSSIGLIGAATNNGKGIAGLTWSGANIIPVKVFNTDVNGGDFADSVSVTLGLDFAREQGARVVNLSLGLPGSQADNALRQAVQRAANANIVLVAAAGNSPTGGILYPASDPNVIAVGALGTGDALAGFSARPLPGQDPLDIAAPGGEAAGSPNNILSLGRGPNEYRLWAGTSESAPLVAGAASLLLGTKPNLTAAQVRQILLGSARSVASPANGGTLRILDVGAALAATPVPVDPTPTTYNVRVDAFRDGASTAARSFVGTARTGATAIPYSLDNLPFGTYTLRATISGGNLNATGTRTVTLNSEERTGQDIQTAPVVTLGR